MGDRVLQQLDEIARLDAQGGVEIDLRPFQGGRQDRFGRGHGAQRLGGQHRGRDHLQLHDRRRHERRAARQLVALGIPRLHGLGVRGDERPRLCFGLGAVVGEVHQPLRGRLLRRDLLALGQHRQRPLQAQHADHADDPARAGQQSKLHFGQAQLGARIVHRDAGVAGERQFEPAAKGRALDQRDDRLAQLLDPAQLRLDRLDLLEDRFRGLLLRVGEGGDVAAGEERLLGRAQDRALDVVLRQPVQRGGE